MGNARGALSLIAERPLVFSVLISASAFSPVLQRDDEPHDQLASQDDFDRLKKLYTKPLAANPN